MNNNRAEPGRRGGGGMLKPPFRFIGLIIILQIQSPFQFIEETIAHTICVLTIVITQFTPFPIKIKH